MSTTFQANLVGDYWSHIDNRWNIELGRHRHRHFFFNPTALRVNLDEGYPYFENDHGNERLEGLLAFIIKTARLGTPLKEMILADFVCRRGLLRNLSMNKHCNTFITFFAVRHRGVIFLCEDKNQGESAEKLRRAMYYNVKFESIMTIPQNTRGITATKKETTKSVIHATLEKGSADPIRLFYAAEIDCLNCEGEPVEMKTIGKPLENGWDKSRSLAWYMQCFLANVKNIVVGERQRNRLKDIRVVNVDMIHAQNTHNWNREECLDHLHSILSFVKQQMSEDGMSFKFTVIHGSTYTSTTTFGDYIVPHNFLRFFPF